MKRAAFPCFSALAIATALGCGDAPQAVFGDELRIVDPCAGPASTWSYLYACFFDNKASCRGQGTCHGSAIEAGAVYIGFVCADKDSCWSSMTQPPPAPTAYTPIVCLSSQCSGGTTDPTQTQLWMALHKDNVSGAGTLANNMPCSASDSPGCPSGHGSYEFTGSDLGLISSWIQNGAQDN